MSDHSLRCRGCGHPEYDCRCSRGGWKGVARTADGVEVTGSTVVFWVYDPDKIFRPAGKYIAASEDGTAEPMSEMYSSKDSAIAHRELH